MNYELKRDRTNGKTEAAIDPKHVLIATIEDKAVRAIAITLAWRRTTIVPALSGAAERRPETVARSRKEDIVTVRSCNFFTVNAVMCRPFPYAIIYKFLAFRFSRHPPTSAPVGCGGIV